MKTTTIQKWGNSYAVRLPKAVVERLRLTSGQAVRVRESVDGTELAITPVNAEEASISDLGARISRTNQHDVCEWGTPVGKEVW